MNGADSEVCVNGECNCGPDAAAIPCADGFRCNGGSCGKYQTIIIPFSIYKTLSFV